jgi:hypothetical protein
VSYSRKERKVAGIVWSPRFIPASMCEMFLENSAMDREGKTLKVRVGLHPKNAI